jgi:hypothetical protein
MRSTGGQPSCAKGLTNRRNSLSDSPTPHNAALCIYRVCGAPHTSVYGRHLILNEEPARLAHMARYAVRPPVAMDRVHEGQDGQVLLEIPPTIAPAPPPSLSIPLNG